MGLYTEYYNECIKEGLPKEQAARIAGKLATPRPGELEQLGMVALAGGVVAAVAVDDALLGIPSAATCAVASVAVDILDFFL